MRTVFEIFPKVYNEEDYSFLCELSYEGISCSLKKVADGKYCGVGVFQFDKNTSKTGLHVALQILFNSHPLFSKNFPKSTIVYSIPESVLVPFSLFDSENSGNVLNLMYGDLYGNGHVNTDIITEASYYNCYRIPAEVSKVLDQQFPNANKWHQYSALIGRHSSKENKMYAIFYSYKIVVYVFIEGKCHLMNTFSFQSPEDAAYYLLAVRAHSGVADLPLELSGFIEKNSYLYNEIHRYFSDITFAALPPLCEYEEQILSYPSHYFSNLFSLDTCG
ncbi:MAG: DUF3822 family protein [Chitinophagaceae bacterium]|nr:DUF3822 family protein [Chitinophagaceae bacterium]MCW5914258.1 DUF3822 family protein [Chitinophagaceae bacterium]MCZ2395506.1 DUF3822 family protein [Chitinophagales bacterium]